MTVQEVINRVKAIRSPAPQDTDVIEMINDVEYDVIRKIMYPRTDDIEFDGYDASDMNTRLMAPRPFDNLYVVGALREIARRENQETTFNNAEREYKEIFGELAAWWTRSHRQAPGHVGSPWWGM